MKRIFKGIFFFLIILTVFFTGLNYLGIALDEEHLEYTQLLPLEDVATQDNGFDLLESGLDQLEEIDSELLDEVLNNEWDQETAKKLIEKYPEHVELVEESLKKTAFKSYPINFRSDFTSYWSYNKLVDLIIIRSRYFAEQDRITESLTALQVALNFIERIKSDRSAILVGYMAGYSNQHKALTWAHEFISNYSLSETELTEAAKLLEIISGYQDDNFEMIFSGEFAYQQTIPGNPPLLERIRLFYDVNIATSYDFGIQTSILDILAIPSHHYFSQKNRTTNKTYLKYLHLQGQAQNTYCNKINYTEESTSSHFLEAFGMNQLHKVGMEQYSMKTYLERRCFANFYVQAIKTSIAFKRYSQKYKSQALSLNQLVPEFLTTIPVDAFTGESVLYNSSAHTIYSRGTNSTDDGGQESNFTKNCQTDESCKINPTVKIEFNRN